jgi:nicotinate-nucleotide pyrophosphorylase (carboxylating)
MGLHDQVLVKDNHLALLGGEAGVASAVAAARAAAPGLRVEVEVTTLEGALAALSARADIVLLDNMKPDVLAPVVAAVREEARRADLPVPVLEASGGVTLENVRAFAETGVDRISVGWITHSAPALDLALDLYGLSPGRDA